MAIEKVFGKPARTEKGGIHVWEYPKTNQGYRWIERLSLPFADNKLLPLKSGYYTFADRELIKGGVPWMIDAARPYETPPVRGKKAKKMPENLKNQLLKLFLEKAQDENANFNVLFQVLQILVEQGVQDEKALAIARKRFIIGGDNFAVWVLHKAGHAEDVTLFVNKVRNIYRKGTENPKSEFLSNGLHNLLAFISRKDKRYPELLRDGLKNLHPDVRASAYYFLNNAPFPKKERLAFVHSGLDDSSERVRYWSVRFLDTPEISKLDWELLYKASQKEQDKNNLKEMKEVLEKHKAIK